MDIGYARLPNSAFQTGGQFFEQRFERDCDDMSTLA